jgi:hypothetical protein
MSTDIPPNIPLQSLAVTIEYRTLAADAGPTLIPETAAVKALEWNGKLHQETVSFSHCRTFEAESNLLAGDSTPEELRKTVAHYEAKREILPSGLMVSISLQTPVRTDSIIGDPVSAVLERPIKVSTAEIIPKGAILRGRVRKFQSLEDFRNTFVVGLEFDELAWPGHSASFLASLSSMQEIPGIASELTSQHVEQIFEGSFQGNRTTLETFTTAAIPGVASFFLQGPGASLPKGLRMTWRTLEAAHP